MYYNYIFLNVCLPCMSKVHVLTVYPPSSPPFPRGAHREVYITYIPPALEVEALEQEIRAICKFEPGQVFTVKWVDEEGQ